MIRNLNSKFLSKTFSDFLFRQKMRTKWKTILQLVHKAILISGLDTIVSTQYSWRIQNWHLGSGYNIHSTVCSNFIQICQHQLQSHNLFCYFSTTLDFDIQLFHLFQNSQQIFFVQFHVNWRKSVIVRQIKMKLNKWLVHIAVIVWSQTKLKNNIDIYKL